MIAHTRKNAYLVFQEDNLGSIQPGKLADLLVLDRDYLTVPADQIKNIKPVMTMVGGRIVYDASIAAQAATIERSEICAALLGSFVGLMWFHSFGAVAELSHSGDSAVAGW